MERTLTCSACGKETGIKESTIKRTEVVMFDGAHIWVSYLQCEKCKKGFPFAYDNKDTLRQGAAGKFLRGILFKRYMGKAYQCANHDEQLELHAPERIPERE